MNVDELTRAVASCINRSALSRCTTVARVTRIGAVGTAALLFFLALGYAEFLRRLRSSRVIRVDSAADEVNAIPADATSPT